MFDNSTKPIFIDKEYDKHLREKLENVLEFQCKDLTALEKINKVLDNINKHLEKFHTKESHQSLTEKFSLEKYNYVQNKKAEEYLSLAKVYKAMKNFEKSAEYFTKAININKDLATMYGLQFSEKTPHNQHIAQQAKTVAENVGKEIPTKKTIFPVQGILLLVIIIVVPMVFITLLSDLRNMFSKSKSSTDGITTDDSQKTTEVKIDPQAMPESEIKRTSEEIEEAQTKAKFILYVLALSLGLVL